MKNKVIATLLCMTMATSLVACGSSTVSDNSVATVSEEEVVETEPEEVVQEEPEEVSNEPEEPEEPVSLMGFNMIDKGDFELTHDEWSSNALWHLYLNSGSAAIDMVDNQLKCDLTKMGSEEHGVQIYYDGFSIEEGCVYEMQFDASSTEERDVQYRIQINGGDYHAYNSEYIRLTPEMQHFDIQFTMEEPSDPAPRLCFNMGKMENGITPEADHTIIFDNFELYCIDESGRVGGNAEDDSAKIAVNQVGYRPNDTKMAVLIGDDAEGAFKVVDAKTGDTVFEGTTKALVENKNTLRNEAQADFSALTAAGSYKIVSDACGESPEFTIADNVYDEAFDASVKMFYLQRCGEKLDAKYAEDFAHDKCHSDLAYYYEDQNGKAVDVSGGWHDAGDYGRYVVPGAKAAEDLLLAYENNPNAFSDSVGIPESGNKTADVLDEARYELEWLFKMQDPDGGVHHKVTCAVFPGTVMPEFETDKLIITPVSTTATGAFAGVMACAARVYADTDKAFADKCLDAAKLAYDYLEKNTSIKGADNPAGISTGAYDDTHDEDERLWAAAELYRTTSDAKYKDAVKAITDKDVIYAFGWQGNGYYGTNAYLSSANIDNAVADKLKKILKDDAASLVANADKDSYKSTIFEKYVWGSNMAIADNGNILLLSDKFCGTNYKEYAKAQVDYLLGNNGNGYCFLTGFGTLSPISTHHRPSQSIKSTMKGMLVGGPNMELNDPYAQNVLAGKAPALCYCDNEQSYSCNEITIYWNSPLVNLMAQLK